MLLFTAIFIFFAVFYNAHIGYIEELQVFIPDWNHISAYFDKPAAFSSLTGDFITQFYCFPVAGAVLITISLILLWYVSRVSLTRLSKNDHVLISFLPVVAAWAALCDHAYPLSNILSVIFSLAAALAITAIGKSTVRLIVSVVTLPLLYAVAGTSFFITIVFIFVFELSGGRRNIINVTAALITGAVVPLLLKDAYLLTAEQAYGYLSEMRKDMFPVDYMPLAAVVAVFILVSLLPGRSPGKPAFSIATALLIAAIAVAAVTYSASFDTERILRLDREARKDNWGKVLELSEKYGMRNSLASYYTNMALSKAGIMPDELMHHYQPAATGLFIPVNADGNYLTITLSNEVHWHLGDVNSAQHSALLGMIFSPRSQNSRLLKRLAEINIVNGEYEAAAKFLRVLEKTWFHSRWAKEMEKLTFDEGLRGSASWIREKRSVIPANDLLRKTEDYVPSLRMLADCNNRNLMAVNYLLGFHLLSKNLDAFAEDFKKYWQPGNRVIPGVYQEAILIRIASGAESREAYRSYMFSPEKVSGMAEYMKLYGSGGGDGRILQEKFDKTYWFFYQFARLGSE